MGRARLALALPIIWDAPLKLDLLDPASTPPATTDPDLHLLNRITWGARPEELARVRQMGRDAYLEEQPDPASIDDSEMDQIVGRFELLNLDRRTLFGLNNYWGRVAEAQVESMILRTVHSKRQLLERMVEFWADHRPVQCAGLFYSSEITGSWIYAIIGV